jgi:hypothetical protein
MDETDTGPFTIPAGRYAVLAVMDTGTGLDAPTQARETPCSARCLK